MATTLLEPEPAIEGLRIHRLALDNFMGIEHAEIDANGRNVKITGPNGSGKTTFAKAIWTVILGISKEVSDPVRDGADCAVIEIDLGKFRVEYKIKANRDTKLEVTALDGTPIPRAREFLDSLFKRAGVNINAFQRLRSQDQIDVIISISGVEPPVAQVMGILGDLAKGREEQLEVREGENAYTWLMRLSGDKELFYNLRAEANRLKDQKAKAAEEQRQIVSRLGGPLKVDENKQSSERLVARLNELMAEKATRLDAVRAKEEAAADYTKNVKALARREAELKAKADKIAHLEAELTMAKGEHHNLVQVIEDGKIKLQHWEKYASDTAADADRLPDPEPEIAKVQSELKNVEITNAGFVKRSAACKELERIVTEEEHASLVWKRWDKALAETRSVRENLLVHTDLGIEDLSIGDGEPLFKGRSLRNSASHAEYTRTSFAIVIRQNKAADWVILDDAEHMTRNTKDLVYQLAADAGKQVIELAATETAKLAITISETV